MYRTLDPDRIIATLVTLHERITARFPGSGLARVCAELVEVARETEANITRTSRPNVWLRLGSFALLVVGALLLSRVGVIIEFKRENENLSGILQGIDAGFNILLVMGGGLLYLSTLETRWKRHQAMEHLHELRSIVHVIDMHQLPKDPSSDRPATVAVGENGAPQRPLTAFELMRYLDYCSEMLSLTGKVAALHAQATKDAAVIAAASDIGQITANLLERSGRRFPWCRPARDGTCRCRVPRYPRRTQLAGRRRNLRRRTRCRHRLLKLKTADRAARHTLQGSTGMRALARFFFTFDGRIPRCQWCLGQVPRAVAILRSIR